MFFAAVSGGLLALGLVATASHLDTAFFAFSLVLSPALAFVGLVTFERALQSGIEDLGYARRIARLRAYYFDYAPELTRYLLSVPPIRACQARERGTVPWVGTRRLHSSTEGGHDHTRSAGADHLHERRRRVAGAGRRGSGRLLLGSGMPFVPEDDADGTGRSLPSWM
jgi:hypothetical protein